MMPSLSEQAAVKFQIAKLRYSRHIELLSHLSGLPARCFNYTTGR